METNKLKKVNYIINLKYRSDDEHHSIDEIWHCSGIADMRLHLCDLLDIIHKNGNTKKPVFSAFKKNLESFADKDFLKKEFNRLKKNYKIFNDVLNLCKKNKTFDYECKVDDNTTLKVYKI